MGKEYSIQGLETPMAGFLYHRVWRLSGVNVEMGESGYSQRPFCGNCWR